MPLKIEPTDPKTPDPEMTYDEFIIRHEHKFLINIYSIDQIKKSDDLKNIESYYIVFNKFISICTELSSVLSQYTKTDMRHMSSDLEEFMEEIFNDDEPEEIKNTIMQTEIKNTLSTSYRKVPKFNLKIYAFAYDKLVISHHITNMTVLQLRIFHKCSSSHQNENSFTSFSHNRHSHITSLKTSK